MAQHVGVDRPQAGARRSRTNDVVHRLPGERLAALGEEKPWQMVTARSQPASDGAQLVAGDGLLDRETILEPFDPDSRPLQVHLVPTKRDRLADAQTMAVHHQDQQVIADAVATFASGFQEGGELGFAEEVWRACSRSPRRGPSSSRI